MREKTCKTCRFWEEIDKRDSVDSVIGTGRCQRYPPVINIAYSRALARELLACDVTHDEVEACEMAVRNVDVWDVPIVVAEFWCGEWRPIEEPMEEPEGKP